MRETTLGVHDLIQPIFLREGNGEPRPIASMPGCYQYTLEQLPAYIDSLREVGIVAVLLFGIPSHKDAHGSAAWDESGVIARAIASIKAWAPEMWVMVDVCCCEYTDHGHCGVLGRGASRLVDVDPAVKAAGRHWEGEPQDGEAMSVDNDATLPLLQRQAVTFAKAGADAVAPSGMMDGMVAAIRSALDQAGHSAVAIVSYAVKYASAFYGPFREAAAGAPQFGDRRGYQMDPANAVEALREAALDVTEGCDMLMVKPAMCYLDVMTQVHQAHPEVPLLAYQVSGEYAMIKAAAERGWIDEHQAVLESLTAIKRAGARVIITYFAKALALRWSEA